MHKQHVWKKGSSVTSNKTSYVQLTPRYEYNPVDSGMFIIDDGMKNNQIHASEYAPGVMSQQTIRKCDITPLRKTKNIRIPSFPGPCPAFCHLQYTKTGRAWYFLSCEHDVITKWQKKVRKKQSFCILFN